jgi:hypothetical protein
MMMYKCNLEKNGQTVWCGYFTVPATFADIADAFCTEAKEWMLKASQLSNTPNPEGWWVDAHYSNAELANHAAHQSNWFLAMAKDVLENCRGYEIYHQEIRIYGAN